MSLPFPEHPLRGAITAEFHARNFEPLRAPARIAHIAYLSGERGSGLNIRHLERLLEHFGAPGPVGPGEQFFADIGELRLRWQRHTEFVTYSFSREGAYQRPFSSSLLETIPEDWLSSLPGKVVTAVLLALEPCDAPGTRQRRIVPTLRRQHRDRCRGGRGCWNCLVRYARTCGRFRPHSGP